MGKRGFIVFLLAALVIMCGALPAFATNGYQLIGVGSIQTSMGGAVTAAPMDAMTAISNPAGIARIGKRADFSLDAFMPKRSVNFESNGGGTTSGGTPMYGIPSIGWAAPAFNRDDMFFGGGMFVTSGLGVDYGQTAMMPAAYGDITFEGSSAVQFWKMAPTVAWNVNKQLALGASLNLDYQSLTIKERMRNVPLSAAGSAMFGGATSMTVNFDLGRPTNQMGLGATFGALYNVNDMVTLGAMYSTQQMFSDAEFRVGTGDVQNFNGATGLAGTYKMDFQFPQQFALGVAVKPVEKLLVDFDVKWINWNSTHDNVKFSGPANSFMDASGNLSNSTDLEFGWKDQWIYALGAQYEVSPAFKVRAGYNYAKSPIGASGVLNNLIFPAIVEQHVSLGVDYMLGTHWGLSASYMKAFSKEITGKGDVNSTMQYLTQFPADSGAKIKLEEDSMAVQLSYLF